MGGSKLTGVRCWNWRTVSATRNIAAGCDVNASGFEQKTALHYAAARGLDPVKLLEAGADPRTRDAAENSPLHAAAAGGHGLVVRALVPYSDPSATNNQGRTALHLSAAKGDVTCLEAIVEAAGPECCMAVDASRHLAVYYAAYNGHYDAAVFFIRVNAPLTNHITGKHRLISLFLSPSRRQPAGYCFRRPDSHPGQYPRTELPTHSPSWTGIP